MDNKLPNIVKDSEIDIRALIQVVWLRRKRVLKYTYITVGIAILFALFSPVEYKATASLLPSSKSDALSSSGGLGALAGLAGVDMGAFGSSSSNEITPQLYTQVVASYPFKKDLVEQEFSYKEYSQPVSKYEYFMADTVLSFGQALMKYTIKLPFTIKESLSGESEGSSGAKMENGLYSLSEREEKLFESLDELFEIEVDEESGVVSITGYDRESLLVAQEVKAAVELLKKYIIQHNTKKTKESIEFMTSMYDEKKAEYEQAQKAYFDYVDSHRGVVLERANFEMQQLSDKYEISTTIYKSVAQQLEQLQLSLTEQTPAFTIIEPVRVPRKRDSPKRTQIVILSIFLGLFLGTCIVIVSSYFKANPLFDREEDNLKGDEGDESFAQKE